MARTKAKPAAGKAKTAAAKAEATAGKTKAPAAKQRAAAGRGPAKSATQAAAKGARKGAVKGATKGGAKGPAKRPSKGVAKVATKGGVKGAAGRSAGKRTAEGAHAPPAKAAPRRAPADVLDFADFPPGSVTRRSTALCLACIFRLFTKQMGLAPRTAYAEIRRYSPTVAELTAREPQRPFFKQTAEKKPRCPYCDAAKRWHARVDLHRVEGGKRTDAPRRALVKKLPVRDGQFVLSEEKKTAREVFFDWLERLGHELDFEDDEAWMRRAARAYLERREPQTDWAEAFAGAARVRRSQRLAEGWERDGARLFLAPALYNDVLLVQYLVSRSHRHGGRTFEGRLTLPELVGRVRAALQNAEGAAPADRFDALEQHVERLSGGDQPVKLHYVLDRRDLLDKAREAYDREG